MLKIRGTNRGIIQVFNKIKINIKLNKVKIYQKSKLGIKINFVYIIHNFFNRLKRALNYLEFINT
jgi:hypothetical protein